MTKKHLLTLSVLLLMLCTPSCKKDSDLDHKTVKIRYEVTTSLPFANSHPVLGALENYISYTSDVSMNEQSVTTLSGKAWTKEITVSDIPKSRIFACSGQFHLQGEDGTANVKIYVNDVIKADVNQLTGSSLQGLTILIVGSQWINQ